MTSLLISRPGAAATEEDLRLTVVIPTYNERGNVLPLLEELHSALVGRSWEALFVDDSSDGTDLILARLSQQAQHVRLLHRDENRGGLAGAVVEGLALAHGEYVCVLDADLQHPPSLIPVLLDEALRTGADLVIASRYLPGGSASGLDGPARHTCSRGLRLLTSVMFPKRLGGVTDPLGGYFLVRRAVAQGAELHPVGYKILLEILIRCPWRLAREVPYRFQPRLHGTSKASFQQGLRFLRHLAILALECSPLFALIRALNGDQPLARPAASSAFPIER